MRKKISQYDARRYKRQIEEMQSKTRADRSCMGGVHLVTFTPGSESRAKLETAVKLHHPLACNLVNGELHVYGVR